MDSIRSPSGACDGPRSVADRNGHARASAGTVLAVSCWLALPPSLWPRSHGRICSGSAPPDRDYRLTRQRAGRQTDAIDDVGPQSGAVGGHVDADQLEQVTHFCLGNPLSRSASRSQAYAAGNEKCYPAGRNRVAVTDPRDRHSQRL
jgi:hypothetical protein